MLNRLGAKVNILTKYYIIGIRYTILDMQVCKVRMQVYAKVCMQVCKVRMQVCKGT